jgi:hypothetical protein
LRFNISSCDVGRFTSDHCGVNFLFRHDRSRNE